MKRFFAMAVVGIGALVIGAIPASPSLASQAELQRALAELRASDAEWRRESGLYRAQRQSGQIKGLEAAEYAEFVAILQRQKLENCENVRRIGGNEALEGTDCLTLAVANPRQEQHEALPEPVRTDAEKAGSLEEQLRTIEAELDKDLAGAQQRGREKAAARVARLPQRDDGKEIRSENPGDGQGTDRTPASPKWSDPGPEKNGDAARAGSETDAGRSLNTETSDEKPGQQRSGSRYPGAGTSGEDKEKSAKVDNAAGESGDDDDVVLRQIRDAAEKETDPVLKEKLWEEYRKMKAARG